jgi:hypothetical protein
MDNGKHLDNIILIPEKDDQYFSNQINDSNNKTEYYSAKSEKDIILDFNEKININRNNNSKISNLNLKNDNECSINFKNKKISLEYSTDSFDSVDDKSSVLDLKDEYYQIKENLNSNEFSKIREIDKKIVNKEISKRMSQNNNRLDKLKRIENKLKNEVKKVFKFDNANNINNVAYPNIPGILKEEKKSKLVLANLSKDSGYSILTKEEANNILDENLFCEYYFYTKKEL